MHSPASVHFEWKKGPIAIYVAAKRDACSVVAQTSVEPEWSLSVSMSSAVHQNTSMKEPIEFVISGNLKHDTFHAKCLHITFRSRNPNPDDRILCLVGAWLFDARFTFFFLMRIEAGEYTKLHSKMQYSIYITPTKAHIQNAGKECRLQYYTIPRAHSMVSFCQSHHEPRSHTFGFDWISIFHIHIEICGYIRTSSPRHANQFHNIFA